MAHTPDLESGPPPAPGADPAPVPAPAPEDEPGADPGADLGRRRFFRQFAGELIQGAASVVGAAQVLQTGVALAVEDPGQHLRRASDRHVGLDARECAAQTSHGTRKHRGPRRQ